MSALYNFVFKRTSTFALTVIGATFFFERAFDMATEYTFEQINQGRMWKHIKHRYTE